MDLTILFYKQKELDQRIFSNIAQALDKETIRESKTLALQIEISELANRHRTSFKYWSKKESDPKHELLEEFVDILHFAISIAIDLGIDGYVLLKKDVLKEKDIRTQFNTLLGAANTLAFSTVKTYWVTFMNYFFGLGEMLGFKQEEIVNAYFKKNKKNHQRQHDGY